MTVTDSPDPAVTLERRKSVIREVMLSLDVRPRQLSRVTGMNDETIRNIAKKIAMKTGTHTQVPVPMTIEIQA